MWDNKQTLRVKSCTAALTLKLMGFIYLSDLLLPISDYSWSFSKTLSSVLIPFFYSIVRFMTCVVTSSRCLGDLRWIDSKAQDRCHSQYSHIYNHLNNVWPDKHTINLLYTENSRWGKEITEVISINVHTSNSKVFYVL